MVLSAYGWLIAMVSLVFTGHSTKDLSGYMHPFYISVTEINYNSKEKIIEISCKIFADDLEKALAKSSGTNVNVADPSAKINNDKLIAGYISKHLQLKVDDKPVSLQFVGSEKEDDVVWSYFQVNNIASVRKLEIGNDILYEIFDTETNLVHVMVNGNRQSQKVTNPETRMIFEW